MNETSPSLLRNKTFLILGLFFLILIYMCCQNILTRSLEYDEIWTLRNYVSLPAGRILSDVATPNNHVLNTLGIKWFGNTFGLGPFTLRLPALLGFTGLFLLLLSASERFLKNPALKILLTAGVLLDGMILHYAETARGYSLQVFFVSGMMLALLCYAECRAGNRKWTAAAWLLCALGSCLSVSSGVLFAAFLTGLWILLFIPFRNGLRAVLRENRSLLIAGCLCGLFILFWYVGNFRQFAAGRAQFGEVFTSVPQYLHYAWNMLWSTGLLWPLAVCAAGAWKYRKTFAGKTGMTAAGTVLLMLISALVTKGGPARVYLPLLPLVWIGAVLTAEKWISEHPEYRRFTLIGTLVILAVCAGFSNPHRIRYSDPDMGVVFNNLRQNVSSDILIAYRPTDAYVVASLFQVEPRADLMERLRAPRFLMLLHDNVLGAMRFPDFATVAFEPGCPAIQQADAGENVPCWLYPLRKIRNGENLKGRPVLCIMYEAGPELQESSSWLKKDFASVNGFLSMGLAALNLPQRYLFAADGAQVNADELIRRETSSGGRLQFFTLGE